MPPLPLYPARNRKIIRLWLTGITSYAAIAQEAGCNVNTVAGVIARRRIQIRLDNPDHPLVKKREAEYMGDIAKRLAFHQGGERHSLSSKNRNSTANNGPLFDQTDDREGKGGGRKIYGHFADQDGRLGRSA